MRGAARSALDIPGCFADCVTYIRYGEAQRTAAFARGRAANGMGYLFLMEYIVMKNFMAAVLEGLAFGFTFAVGYFTALILMFGITGAVVV